MAVKLREAGITNFAIFEKSDGISGTWHDHTYPGLVCDVPSHLYSYSFDLNPDWSHVFSPQAEIKAYVERVVDKHGIRPHIHLNSEVVAARFDEETAVWQIRAKDGTEIQARSIVSGIGGLSRPAIPDFPGIDEFAGTQFHTARWQDDHDFTGERVAVIGSAASAIQLVPQIAPAAQHIHLFQRTPNYIVPRPDRKISQAQKDRFRRNPWLMRLARWMIFLIMDQIGFRAFKQGSWLGAQRTKAAINHMRSQISDPELQQKLIPDYCLQAPAADRQRIQAGLGNPESWQFLAQRQAWFQSQGILRSVQLGGAEIMAIAVAPYLERICTDLQASIEAHRADYGLEAMQQVAAAGLLRKHG